MNNIDKKMDYIIMQNKALIEMMDSLVKAYAKANNLAIEEEECEYIDIERLDK